MDIRNLIRENIRNLAPYSTARDDYQGTELSIALDANENPYDNGVNRYPDPRQKALRHAFRRSRTSRWKASSWATARTNR